MNIEQRKSRIELIVKILGMLVAGLIAAPFVFIAIKGLIGLIAAAIVAFIVIQFTPFFASLIANWRLKAIKAEAARNPVETLQNDYQKRQTALGEFREAIKVFMTEIQNFKDRLVVFVKQHPREAEKFKLQLQKMEQLLNVRQQKYERAKDGLHAFELEIQKAGAIWEMAQAAAAMNEAAGLSEEDFLARIQVETALDSVQENLNLAFSDLEMSLRDEVSEGKKPLMLEDGSENLPPKYNNNKTTVFVN